MHVQVLLHRRQRGRAGASLDKHRDILFLRCLMFPCGRAASWRQRDPSPARESVAASAAAVALPLDVMLRGGRPMYSRTVTLLSFVSGMAMYTASTPAFPTLHARKHRSGLGTNGRPGLRLCFKLNFPLRARKCRLFPLMLSTSALGHQAPKVTPP